MISCVCEACCRMYSTSSESAIENIAIYAIFSITDRERRKILRFMQYFRRVKTYVANGVNPVFIIHPFRKILSIYYSIIYIEYAKNKEVNKEGRKKN